jgi:hypothetical protein
MDYLGAHCPLRLRHRAASRRMRGHQIFTQNANRGVASGQRWGLRFRRNGGIGLQSVPRLSINLARNTGKEPECLSGGDGSNARVSESIKSSCTRRPSGAERKKGLGALPRRSTVVRKSPEFSGRFHRDDGWPGTISVTSSNNSGTSSPHLHRPICRLFRHLPHFAAGTVITETGYNGFREFDRIIGVDRLLTFPPNAPERGKLPCCRHEHRQGAMGLEPSAFS